MKSLSIKAHLWIAFAIIPIIPIVFLSTLHIVQTNEPSFQLAILNIIIALGFTLLLGYFHAKRINTTIKMLVEYIEKAMSEDYEIKAVSFPRFAPREFHMMAEHSFIMAQKTKDGQQALLKLNAELEQRVAERTESLQRTNSELAGVIIQKEMLSQTLLQNHAVLKAVLESMYDAITLIDKKQEVVYANGRMPKLLDIPQDKLSGLSEEAIFDLISGRVSDSDRQVIKQAKQEYGLYRFKINYGDNQQYIMLSAFPVIGDDHHTIGKGFVWRDITKEHEVDKLKSDLISMVSHEFKTPITSIKGSVETLLRVDAEWEEDFKREMLTGIHEDIEHIQELVNDWLDISRIDAKAISLDWEPVRPSTVVDNAVRKLPKHFACGAKIESTVDESLPFIYGDRVRLGQVLSNLLTNAIRYNRRNPHIKISANYDEKYVYISVEDNGIGINAKHLDKVFEHFYCVDTGRDRPSGGTGLGLSICKGIVEAHSGSIRVESCEGIGSVFTVSIPKYKDAGDNYEQM